MLIVLLIISVVLFQFENGFTCNYNYGTSSDNITKLQQRILQTSVLEVKWNYTYGGDSEDCYFSSPLIETSDGGFLIAAHTNSYGNGQFDMWLVKTDSNGILQWNRTYGGEQSDQIFDLIETSDGGFLLGGSTTSYGEGGDAFLVKTHSDGTLNWNHTFGGSGNEAALTLLETSDGGILVGGLTLPQIHYTSD